MNTPEEIKLVVQEKYGRIAEQSKNVNASCCCGAGASDCAPADYFVIADDYKGQEGYLEDADLALGCGLPTQYAGLKPGMTVLDLGSGAGNDVFIAAREVGPEGRVIGVDMTEAMIEKANANKHKINATTVEFRLGDIEQLPVDDACIDVVISNCVLNLVPDKTKAFSELFRVLKPGGHFCVSDIVREGHIHQSLMKAAELYVGCIAGSLTKEAYLNVIRETGFTSIEVVKEKEILIPEDVLLEMTKHVPEEHRNLHGTRILSATVIGRKE